VTAPAMPSIRPFTEIVERFDESVPCEQLTGCDQDADWHIQYHSCSDVLLCDAHFKGWAEEVTAKCLLGAVRCCHCSGIFPSLDSLFKAWPI